ncbi:MAG: hypothetical protein L0G51_00105 [Lactococcus lactis]|nr:hypothetical protein [Lactococcus lactis]
MEKLAVHVEPFHNLLVGDENSTAIPGALVMKLGLDVDGDYIIVENTLELSMLKTAIALSKIHGEENETN